MSSSAHARHSFGDQRLGPARGSNCERLTPTLTRTLGNPPRFTLRNPRPRERTLTVGRHSCLRKGRSPSFLSRVSSSWDTSHSPPLPRPQGFFLARIRPCRHHSLTVYSARSR